MRPIERRLAKLEARAPGVVPVFLTAIFRAGDDPAPAEAEALAKYQAEHGHPPPANFQWMHIRLVSPKHRRAEHAHD